MRPLLPLALILSLWACAPTGTPAHDAGTTPQQDAGSTSDAGSHGEDGGQADSGFDAGCIRLTCQPGVSCDDLDDGCGGTLHCGACSGDQVCGGSGTPNVCSACLAPVFPSSIPDAEIGTDYSTQLIAAGYGVMQYSVVSGALPRSLTLSEYGSLYGTPHEHGRFAFDVQVVDSCPTPHTARASFGINVTIPGAGALAVTNGLFHSLAVTDSSAVYAWGSEEDGALGSDVSDPTHTRYQPAPVLDANEQPLENGVTVAATDRASFALLSNGQVYSWGKNEFGVLGNGTTETGLRASPVLLSGGSPLSNVTAIAAGQDHMLALLNDGTVMAWGKGDDGRLGNGGTASQSNPQAVQVTGGGALSGVIAIAASARAGAALFPNHHVVTWGRDSHAHLLPTALKFAGGAEVDQVVAIAGGSAHFLALRDDGTVVAWGDNEQGELGNGHTLQYDQDPVVVQASAGVPLTGVTMIAAGDRFSLALKNGQVLGWGKNNIGELGDGTWGLSRPYPVVTQTFLGEELSGATAIAASRATGWAFITGRHVVGWGDNSLGKLAMPWGFTTARDVADYVLLKP